VPHDVTPAFSGDPASVTVASDHQARRMAFAARGDVDGLVGALYTEDARLHGFDFRAEGRPAIRDMIERMGRRLADLGPVRVRQRIAGRDFIWQELVIDGPDGPIEPYEVKLLRGDRVYLQLYGLKRGTVWQPGDVPGGPAVVSSEAEGIHRRYVDYQVRQDADGIADAFFTADARLVTSRVRVEGRERLRAFFRHKFAAERDFRLVSMHRMTSDRDYVWFEATAGGSLGVRTVYDLMSLRDGRVSLQLVGTLDGVLPSDAATPPGPEVSFGP
jgi:hypothetical protein